LYGIIALGVLMFLANILITGMFTWELGKVAVDVGLSAVSISGLIIIFFFSIQMVSYDLERKTIYLILSKPIGKSQYILGKFVGLAVILLISSLVLGACSFLSVKLAIFSGGSMPQHFSWNTFFLSLGYQTLSLFIVLAIAFICISVTTNAFTAVLLCMVAYFIGQNIEKVINIIIRGKMYEQNPLLLPLIKKVAWVFPNLAAFDLKTTAAYGLPVDAIYLFWTGIYGLSYIAVSLIVAMLIFQRRELG
jgi:ABC-type transport system involved in multi-copper enzyme maturation permease subunit